MLSDFDFSVYCSNGFGGTWHFYAEVDDENIREWLGNLELDGQGFTTISVGELSESLREFNLEKATAVIYNTMTILERVESTAQDNRRRLAYEGYIRNMNLRMSEDHIEDFDNAFFCFADNVKEFAMRHAGESGRLHGMPEDLLKYIDWDLYAEDLMHDFWSWDIGQTHAFFRNL